MSQMMKQEQSLETKKIVAFDPGKSDIIYGVMKKKKDPFPANPKLGDFKRFQFAQQQQRRRETRSGEFSKITDRAMKLKMVGVGDEMKSVKEVFEHIERCQQSCDGIWTAQSVHQEEEVESI